MKFLFVLLLAFSFCSVCRAEFTEADSQFLLESMNDIQQNFSSLNAEVGELSTTMNQYTEQASANAQTLQELTICGVVFTALLWGSVLFISYAQKFD